MRLLSTPLAAALLVAASFATHAWAAGYSIYEQGAAVLGMAGAGTASVHDASAVFFNPAVMTRLEGTQVYLGGSALQPVTSFAGKGANPGYGTQYEMVRQTFYPPMFYATRLLPRGWAMGVGLNAPFGLGTAWDAASFPGRYISTKVDLQTLNGSACLAWAPDERWSFAAGGDVLWVKAKLQNHELVPVPGGGGALADVAEVTVASGFKPAPGWNAAVLFTPAARWRIGGYYRSKIVVHVDDADVTFAQIPTGDAVFDAAVAAGLPPDQEVSTVLRVPAMWSLGTAYDPAPAWTVEADFNLHEWKVFKDLPLEFSDTPEINTRHMEDYGTGWQIRAGAEHRLPALTYRFGYYFDHSPAPTYAVTPLLPDADRHGVSLGLGWSFGTDKRWTVDAYELALFAVNRFGTAAAAVDEPREYQFRGEYKTYINLAGINLGYRW
jgi:long-chain fatty acid transport protein